MDLEVDLVYRADIPQPTDFISKSQRQIQNNFQDVFDIWGRSQEEDQNVGDHVPLNNPEEENRGKHKQVSLIDQDPIPTAAADEAVLYSEKQNTQSELFYIRNGDATGNQLTSNGQLSVGGLSLRAYVLFDQLGNIIQNDDVDDEGEPIKVPISFNIQSVQQVIANQDKWLITFSNALETDNYMWIAQTFSNTFSTQGFQDISNPQPGSDAVYGNSITTGSFLFMNSVVTTVNPPTQPARELGRRMLFQAYTVAQ